MKFARGIFVTVLLAFVFYKGAILSMDYSGYFMQRPVYYSVEPLPAQPVSYEGVDYDVSPDFSAPIAQPAPSVDLDYGVVGGDVSVGGTVPPPITQPIPSSVDYEVTGSGGVSAGVPVSPTASGMSDKEKLETIMKMAISILFLPAGLFVILSRKYDEGSKKWAFATLGTIIGAWFG